LSSPITKEDLEKESSNSVSNLHRHSDENLDNETDAMQKTMSSNQLQEMFKHNVEEAKEESPT
jgi:hypothetical protein